MFICILRAQKDLLLGGFGGTPGTGGDAQSFLGAVILMALNTLLSSSSPDMRAHLLLDKLECPLVLGDNEQLHGTALIGIEHATPLGSCPVRTRCAWSGTRGGCCPPACSCKVDLVACGPVGDPRPWGSTEP